MKLLSGGYTPWGKCYLTLLGSLGGGTNNDPERRKKVTLIAVAVILISLVSLFFTMCEHAPKINPLPFIGLGEMLAEESITAIDNHGTVVPVLADYHTTGSTPMTHEWKAFAKETKRHSGVKLADPVIVKLAESGMGEPGISRADFDNLVKKNSTAGALVFFVGLPPWDAANPLTLPPGSPKIIAVHNSPQPAKPYFANSITAVIITARQTPETQATGEPKTPRQAFDRYFQVFTTQNYQSLAD